VVSKDLLYGVRGSEEIPMAVEAALARRIKIVDYGREIEEEIAKVSGAIAPILAPMGSGNWEAGFLTALGWIVSTLIYQIGRLLGFG